MDGYTRYYVNQSGGGEIGPVYRASIRMDRVNVIRSFFMGLFRFVKPLLNSGAKALKTVSNIITDIIYKQVEQPVGNIFKTRFIEAKDKIEENIKKMTGVGLGLKKKRQPKKPQSQGKRKKVKDIFTEEEKKKY